jgi:hypothetical protein
MTKEQALAIARARLALKKQTQVSPDQPPTPEQPTPQVKYAEGPYTEEPMDDALTVSETGIETSPGAVKATIRNVLQGMSFATADEAEAALRTAFGDKSYDENIDMIRQEMKAYAEANPGSALSQELIGAVMTPAGLLKAPKYIEAAAPMIRGAIKGGTGGFVYGVGGAEGDLLQRGEEGLVSAGVGMILGAPLEKAATLLGNAKLNRTIKRQNQAPTSENLRTLKDDAYAVVDQSAFAIGPGEATQIYNRASKVADDAQYITTPGTVTAVDKAKKLLEKLTTQGMTLGQSERVRRRLFKLADDPTDGYIVREMIHEFDDVIDQAMEQGGTAALQIARTANARFKKVELLEEAFNKIDVKGGPKSELYKKTANNLLANPKAMKYWSAEEKAMLERLASGTASQNMLNWFGKFSPTAKGLAGALNFTAFAINPWLAVLYVGTSGAKALADKKAVKQAQKIIKEVGGIDVVRRASQNPNAGTFTVGGVSADQIREEFLLKENEE